MRWHPMIIKWCLYMRNKSRKAYDTLRNTGFIALPSTRTLFDYSHILPSKTGFEDSILEHLIKEAQELGMYSEPHKSFVGILQDEVKVSQGLVYDKKTGELVGFVDLDSTSNELMKLENILNDSKPGLATNMLVIMVRGISSSLKYPIACFPTKGITADFLYPILWETVESLEYDCNLKPVFITCDGAAANRKFFALHKSPTCTSGDDCFWTWNPFSMPKRKMFFISDVPHLLKTARNCFSNSYSHNQKRKLWKDGRDISWAHILRLYEENIENNLYCQANKITRSHIDLTPFSKMKVNYAAQIFSETVASSLELMYGDSVLETVHFIRHMNKFFDCLNTRNLKESARKRNDNLKPYCDIDDPRFEYLTKDFLGYFSEWKTSVNNRNGDYSKSEKDNMQLSHQTLSGLHISVNSIVECSKFLLSEGVEFILTSHYNQDPLEEEFSHLRHKGGSNDNPTVYDIKNNLSQMRVIGSTALAPIHSNITKHRKAGGLPIDCRPIAKKPRFSKLRV
ncbi:hypothetical protein SNE40_022391 [Patella caerulea]